jgi:hypothetical protein
MLRKKTKPDAAGQGAIVDPDGESIGSRLFDDFFHLADFRLDLPGYVFADAFGF